MRFCLFVKFRNADGASRLAEDAVRRIDDVLREVPDLARALIHTPARASDPFLPVVASPLLVLQLYFAELQALEAASDGTGPLATLAAEPARFALAAADASLQAMVVRGYPVPEPAATRPARDSWCSYLVAYEGEADDLNAWHDYYLRNHTAMMARMSGIRALEVYTRLDAVSRLPWRREAVMQRNRVMFDDPAALDRALASPLRAQMRADFQAFPHFTGGNVHYPMLTRLLQRA